MPSLHNCMGASFQGRDFFINIFTGFLRHYSDTYPTHLQNIIGKVIGKLMWKIRFSNLSKYDSNYSKSVHYLLIQNFQQRFEKNPKTYTSHSLTFKIHALDVKGLKKFILMRYKLPLLRYTFLKSRLKRMLYFFLKLSLCKKRIIKKKLSSFLL